MSGLSNAELNVLTREHEKDRQVMMLQLEQQRRTNPLLVALLQTLGHGADLPTPQDPVRLNWRGKSKER